MINHPDKTAMYVDVFDGPHKDGTFSFLVDWWAEGFHMGPRWRGQVFRTHIGFFFEGFNRQRKLVVKDTRWNQQIPIPKIGVT